MTAPTSSRRPCRSTTATSTPGSDSIGATGGRRSGARARDRAAGRNASHFLIDSSASLLYQGSGTSPQNSTERAVPSSGSRFSGGAPSEKRPLMNIPEEFGKYLLLKKLTEDPLGETFRAGKVGKEGMEQVLLLRVFNGKGVDGEKLWQKASGRAAVQE